MRASGNWFRTIGAVLFIAALCRCAGSKRAELPVDLATARLAPPHSPVAVDGRESDGEWAGAISVALQPEGEARFFWDERGLYALVHGYSPGLFPGPAFSITVYTADRFRTFRVHVGRLGREGNEMALDVICPLFPPATAPADWKDVAFGGFVSVAKRGVPVSAELFIPWSLLTDDGRRPEDVRVVVSRIVENEKSPGRALRLQRNAAP